MLTNTTFSRNLKNVTLDYWLMLFTLFFMKFGQFMLMPFLAIYLAKESHLTPAAIGLVIGIGPFVYGIAGLAAGVLIDRFGVKNGMVGALLGAGIAIFYFFLSHSMFWYLLMNILTGVTRAFFDIGSKSYANASLSLDARRFCFSLRFMVVNSAAAIGPVVGAYFATSGSLLSFEIIGVSYLILGVLSLFILRDEDKSVLANPSTLKELMQIIFTEKKLQILLVVSTIIWIVYAQLDSTLAQYLSTSLDDGIRIYAWLLIINAIGCVALQLLITQLTKNLDENLMSTLAMLLFAVAFAIIAFTLNFPALICAAIFIVLAETIIMPLNDFILARIAPSDRIGTYYGVMGLAMLGLGIGPMMGGVIYQAYSAKILFYVCSGLCLVAIIFYRKIIRKE